MPTEPPPDDQPDQPDGDAPSRHNRRGAPRPGRPDRQDRTLRWLIIATASTAAVIWALVLWGIYGGPSGAAAATPPTALGYVPSTSVVSSTTGSGGAPSTTGTDGSVVQSTPPDAINIARASADASTAASAAASLAADTDRLPPIVSNANTGATDISQLSTTQDARNPEGTNPTADEQQLEGDATALGQILDLGQQSAATAVTAASDAATIVQGNAIVATETAAAQASAARAQQALAQIQSAVSQVDKLLAAANSQLQSWTAVHNAPAGTLSMQGSDPPSSWSVRGCEVITADAGGAALAAHLVGQTQRTDPVGDVITAITDVTDHDTTWPISDCSALDAAMAQTRIGDTLTIIYEHRQVIWYELSGTWVERTSTIQLRGTDCPGPVTGTISGAGDRIRLQINLSGPAGAKDGVNVILDTGGIQPTFPDGLLRSLGYTPTWGPLVASGIVPNATVQEYLYDIPATAITIMDGGRSVPVATGNLSVMGIVGGSGDYLLGPSVLKQGASLSTSGPNWTFIPPCSAG